MILFPLLQKEKRTGRSGGAGSSVAAVGSGHSVRSRNAVLA